MAILEDKFIDHMKTIRHELLSLKPQADDQALYQVLTDRLQALYGWDKGTGQGISTQSAKGRFSSCYQF